MGQFKVNCFESSNVFPWSSVVWKNFCTLKHADVFVWISIDGKLEELLLNEESIIRNLKYSFSFQNSVK